MTQTIRHRVHMEVGLHPAESTGADTGLSRGGTSLT